jgi:DNA repair protein RecO (recombination protein O)
MPLIETDAIVLNSLKLGEADKLVTFYSPTLGKIKAVARGARKIKNKYGSSLEPFTHGHLVIYDKKPQVLYRLFQSDIIESFQRVRSDYDKIMTTSHFSLFIEALSPEGDPSVPVFNLFLKLLEYTKVFEASPGLINLFKVKFLGYAGYELLLDRCVKCQSSSPSMRFSPSLGGMVCSPCIPDNALYSVTISPAVQSVLKQTFKMDPGLISRIRPSEEVNKEISHILEVFIFHILGKKFPSLEKTSR